MKDLSQNACQPVHDKCLAALKVVRGNSQLNVDWISSLKAGPSLMLQSKGQEDHFLQRNKAKQFRIKGLSSFLLH